MARKGSHALFAPDTFAALRSADQPVLAPDQRSTRARMIAIADGYFEGIAQHDSRLVSSAIDCSRFENGVRMTNGPVSCAHAAGLRHRRRPPHPHQGRARTPLSRGGRGAGRGAEHVVFDIPADPAATPPHEARMLLRAELFTIAGGEIQQIETVMHNLPYGAASGWNAR